MRSGFKALLGLSLQVVQPGQQMGRAAFPNAIYNDDLVQMWLGIEHVPPLVARGIVLDMAGHFGVEYMNAGQFFTVEDVQAVEKKQRTPVREGDVVLFHTGWTDAKLESDPDAWVAGEPGQSEEVAVQMIINPIAIH